MFKKFAAAVVAVILASSLYAYAGDRSGARLGIMAGFTSSSSNAKNLDPSSIGRYHFGVTAEIPVAFGFAVQPSVLYQAKGTKLSDAIPGLHISNSLYRYNGDPISWLSGLMCSRNRSSDMDSIPR